MTQSNDGADKRPKVTFRNITDFENASTIDPPENFFEESIMLRPRSMSHHLSSTKIPSRTWLKIQANFWRSMMGLGMHFHDFAPPRPPKAAYTRKIATDTIPIKLFFYLPPDYKSIIRSDPSHRFPAVVNFHGGGFVLGHATDDRYWARVVTRKAPAIFISVNYRRAPEHPFPVPVDDCVEALLYISTHASDLHVDTSNIALSGFSAGANLAFAVPLRLTYHRKMNIATSTSASPTKTALLIDGKDAIEEDEEDNKENVQQRDFGTTPNQSTSRLLDLRSSSPITIRSIVAWYPLLDWTTSRSQKKRESRNPQKCLPKTFTDLFDHAYLPGPDKEGNHCSPYASPGLAPDHMVHEGLPQDIQMWLCEWDMLLREGQKFSERLEKLGKNVDSKVVPRVPHGWDKSPNPFRDQDAIDCLYAKAARGLNEVFTSRNHLHRSSSSIHDGDVLAERQPRRSVVPM